MYPIIKPKYKFEILNIHKNIFSYKKIYLSLYFGLNPNSNLYYKNHDEIAYNFLTYAAIKQNYQIVKLLLKYGANANTKSSYCIYTFPLLHVCMKIYHLSLDIYTSKHCYTQEYNSTNKVYYCNDNCFLHNGCYYCSEEYFNKKCINYYKIMIILIKNTNINLIKDYEYTPVSYCSMVMSSIKPLKILLKYNFDPNQGSYRGFPLSCAYYRNNRYKISDNNFKCFYLLLIHGANPDLDNTDLKSNIKNILHVSNNLSSIIC